MKAMIISDFVISRRYFATQLLLSFFVSAFWGFGFGNLYTFIPVFACMGTLTLVFNLAAVDESRGWESFRLTLPMGRSDVVRGRYASTLLLIAGLTILGTVIFLLLAPLLYALFSTQFVMNETLMEQLVSFSIPMLLGVIALSIFIMLFMSAVVYPISLRFGLTKTGRILPLGIAVLVMVVAFSISSLNAGDFGAMPQWLQSIVDWASTAAGVAVLCLGALAIGLGLYFVSYSIAARLYKGREF